MSIFSILNKHSGMTPLNGLESCKQSLRWSLHGRPRSPWSGNYSAFLSVASIATRMSKTVVRFRAHGSTTRVVKPLWSGNRAWKSKNHEIMFVTFHTRKLTRIQSSFAWMWMNKNALLSQVPLRAPNAPPDANTFISIIFPFNNLLSKQEMFPLQATPRNVFIHDWSAWFKRQKI